jgi:hypothetical protein
MSRSIDGWPSGKTQGDVMSNVLVVFQSNTERTEQMALAVAVGAVEAEGSIRLRRLAAADAVEVGHKGYGTIKAADLLWADTVVVGLEDSQPKPEELDGLLSLLSAAEPGTLAGKQSWTFSAEGLVAQRTEAQILVEAALQAAGMTLLPSEAPDADDMMEQMKKTGRKFGQTHA